MRENSVHIIVSDVPPGFLKRRIIRGHFAQFGTISRLSTYNTSCIISFETKEQAKDSLKNGASWRGMPLKVDFIDEHDPFRLEEYTINEELNWYPEYTEPLERPKEKPKEKLVERPKPRATKIKASAKVLDAPPQKIIKISEVLNKEEVQKDEEISNIVIELEETYLPKPPEETKILLKTQDSYFRSKVCTSLDDKLSVLEERDRQLRQNIIKVARDEAMRGTCPDMCPEKERIMRDLRGIVAQYEAFEDGRMDYRKSVKEYTRSSADQEEPLPHELRPEPVLTVTMTYLINLIISRIDKVEDENYANWYDFCWGRLRAIRKDIIQQQLCNIEIVCIIEQCARFHIACYDRLWGISKSHFDDKINTETLINCLQSLLHMYEDLRKEGVICPNEAEFNAYMILLKLNSGFLLSEYPRYSLKLKESRQVKEAVRIHLAYNNNMYATYFKITKNTSYLKACLLQRFFQHLRVEALYTIVRAHSVPNKTSALSVQFIMDSLKLDSFGECIAFCDSFGISLSEDRNDFRISRNEFYIPETVYTIKSPSSLIVKKRIPVAEAVVGEGNPLPNYKQYDVHNSFDYNGVMKQCSIDAADQEEKMMRDSLERKVLELRTKKDAQKPASDIQTEFESQQSSYLLDYDKFSGDELPEEVIELSSDIEYESLLDIYDKSDMEYYDDSELEEYEEEEEEEEEEEIDNDSIDEPENSPKPQSPFSLHTIEMAASPKLPIATTSSAFSTFSFNIPTSSSTQKGEVSPLFPNLTAPEESQLHKSIPKSPQISKPPDFSFNISEKSPFVASLKPLSFSESTSNSFSSLFVFSDTATDTQSTSSMGFNFNMNHKDVAEKKYGVSEIVCPFTFKTSEDTVTKSPNRVTHATKSVSISPTKKSSEQLTSKMFQPPIETVQSSQNTEKYAMTIKSPVKEISSPFEKHEHSNRQGRFNKHSNFFKKDKHASSRENDKLRKKLSETLKKISARKYLRIWKSKVDRIKSKKELQSMVLCNLSVNEHLRIWGKPTRKPFITMCDRLSQRKKANLMVGIILHTDIVNKLATPNLFRLGHRVKDTLGKAAVRWAERWGNIAQPNPVFWKLVFSLPPSVEGGSMFPRKLESWCKEAFYSNKKELLDVECLMSSSGVPVFSSVTVVEGMDSIERCRNLTGLVIITATGWETAECTEKRMKQIMSLKNNPIPVAVLSLGPKMDFVHPPSSSETTYFNQSLWVDTDSVTQILCKLANNIHLYNLKVKPFSFLIEVSSEKFLDSLIQDRFFHEELDVALQNPDNIITFYNDFMKRIEAEILVCSKENYYGTAYEFKNKIEKSQCYNIFPDNYNDGNFKKSFSLRCLKCKLRPLTCSFKSSKQMLVFLKNYLDDLCCPNIIMKVMRLINPPEDDAQLADHLKSVNWIQVIEIIIKELLISSYLSFKVVYRENKIKDILDSHFWLHSKIVTQTK